MKDPEFRNVQLTREFAYQSTRSAFMSSALLSDFVSEDGLSSVTGFLSIERELLHSDSVQLVFLCRSVMFQ